MTRQTEASPEALYTFVRARISKHDTAEDRSGRTELQALSDELSSLAFDAPALQAYFTVAPRLVGEIPKLSDAETTRLVNFVLSTRVLPPRVVNEAQRALKRVPEEDASKRADILRLLQRLGRRLIPAEIAKDQHLRNARPWAWFDLALAAAPDVAIAALPELSKHAGFFGAMLSRLVRVWRSTDVDFPTFMEALCTQLSEDDRQKLTDYLRAMEISAPSTETVNIGDFARFAQDLSARVSPLNTLDGRKAVA